MEGEDPSRGTDSWGPDSLSYEGFQTWDDGGQFSY